MGDEPQRENAAGATQRARSRHHVPQWGFPFEGEHEPRFNKKALRAEPRGGSLVASFKEDWIWSEVRIERTESAGTGFTV